MWLDGRQINEVTSLDGQHERWPIPTQMLSNGEFMPIPQTPQQKHVEHLMGQLADRRSRELGMSRRDFLRSSLGGIRGRTSWQSVCGVGGHSKQLVRVRRRLSPPCGRTRSGGHWPQGGGAAGKGSGSV